MLGGGWETRYFLKSSSLLMTRVLWELCQIYSLTRLGSVTTVRIPIYSSLVSYRGIKNDTKHICES